MQQVLTNLIENGIKFTPKGGQVKISTSTMASTARITVEDTGVGIDPQVLPVVFEMFQQGQVRGKRAPGLGIGLALVKSIVSLHGGRVSAESVAGGRGSRFIVALPVCEARDISDQKEHHEARRDRYKLLLIEDVSDIRDFLAETLAELDYQVFTAESGEAALEVLDRQAVDVILADLGLPGMDGYEFLSQARRHPHASRALAFALTGYGQEKDLRRSQEVGYDEHLVKPLNVEEIDCRIRSRLKKIPDVSS